MILIGSGRTIFHAEHQNMTLGGNKVNLLSIKPSLNAIFCID